MCYSVGFNRSNVTRTKCTDGFQRYLIKSGRKRVWNRVVSSSIPVCLEYSIITAVTIVIYAPAQGTWLLLFLPRKYISSCLQVVRESWVQSNRPMQRISATCGCQEKTPSRQRESVIVHRTFHSFHFFASSLFPYLPRKTVQLSIRNVTRKTKILAVTIYATFWAYKANINIFNPYLFKYIVSWLVLPIGTIVPQKFWNLLTTIFST